MDNVRRRARRTVKGLGRRAAVAAAPSLRLNRRYADVVVDVSTTASGLSASSQWERIEIAPDVELHVRRPLSRHQNRAVERLIAFARNLFQEGT